MFHMLSISDFIFSVYIDTDYHQFTRIAESGYNDVKRAGQYPATPFTEKKLETISLNGQILGPYATVRLNKLRSLLTNGPQLVMKSNGENLGQWLVLRVTETADKLIDDGTALKTTFKVDLRQYQE